MQTLPSCLLDSSARLFLAAITLFSAACAIAPDDAFDPYARETNSGGERLRFFELPTRKSLSPADLRPGRDAFTVGPGDLLEIEIVEVPNTKAVTTVLPDGTLYYDTAGPVDAAGRTIADLERELARELEEHYSFPLVNINLKKVQSRTFTVLGQVKKQGVYEMSQPTTVLDAISAAGGTYTAFTNGRTQELADLGRSILVRDNHTVPVDFEALIDRGDMTQNVYLKPGDYLYLPAAGTERVFVLGAVRFPTSVGYSSKLTLASALATAKGPAPNAYVAGALLIRGSATRPQVARIDLYDVIKGREPDFRLEPGDILWVPKAPWQKLQEYALVAVDAAVRTVAVRETASLFTDETVDVTVTTDNFTSASGTTSRQSLTLSTGPETVEISESLAASAPLPAVESPGEPLLSNALLSNAFGN